MELRKILCPLDGSDLAERALPLVEQLAARAGAEVFLARAPLPRVYSGLDAIEAEDADAAALAETEQYLRQICERLRRHGVRCVAAPAVAADEDHGLDVGQVVRPSMPFRQLAEAHREAAQAIARVARKREVDLIVMATHGRSGIGRWAIGSVAHEILRLTHTPVLLVRAGSPDALPVGEDLRILVPLDGSAVSEAALPPAVALARLLDGQLLLVQVIPHLDRSLSSWLSGPLMTDPAEHAALEAGARSYLERIRSALTETGSRVEVTIGEGDPAVVITRIARDRRAGVVALAMHERSTLFRLASGSVGESVMTAASSPVLAVRPGDVPDEQRPVPAIESEAPATPRARPVTLTLDPEEIELARTALLALLQSAAREDHLSEPIHHLVGKLDEAARPAPPADRGAG
jgi:nucleotide-binding universal stress UspA family protein